MTWCSEEGSDLQAIELRKQIQTELQITGHLFAQVFSDSESSEKGNLPTYKDFY